MIARKAAVTVDGHPCTLIGPELKIGDKAPDFHLLANDFSEVTLASSQGKVRLLLSVGSLDTGICDAEIKRFNEEAVNLHGDVVIYCISCDLPFAQARWCGTSDIDKVQTLSDHRETSFGIAYGTLVKESRLLSRAVFIVDADDRIRYVQYVPEVAQHPDYVEALTALQQIAG
jgi:thiol peroxidase